MRDNVDLYFSDTRHLQGFIEFWSEELNDLFSYGCEVFCDFERNIVTLKNYHFNLVPRYIKKLFYSNFIKEVKVNEA